MANSIGHWITLTWLISTLTSPHADVPKANVTNLLQNNRSARMASSFSQDKTWNSSEKVIIKVGVILPNNSIYQFNHRKIVPSILQAEAQLAKRNITSGFVFQFYYGDSHCDTKHGPLVAYDFYRHHRVNCFIGPVCDYSVAPIARYSPFWMTSLISPGALSHSFQVERAQKFRTLTRVGATFNSMTMAFQAYMNYFGWRKLKVIYDALSSFDNQPLHRYCYLATSTIVGTLKHTEIEVKYSMIVEGKYEADDVLKEAVGTEISGKFRHTYSWTVYLLGERLIQHNRVSDR